MYAIIKIAINIYSGTLFIEMAMGWSQYASVIGPARQNYISEFRRWRSNICVDVAIREYVSF